MCLAVSRRAAALLFAALAAGCGTAGDAALPTDAPEAARAAYGPAESGPRDAPAIAPDALLGMTAATVTGLLGPPAFLRREGPAQVWQYRSDLCVVDLFLYPPVKAADGDALQVAYAELRRSGAAARVRIQEAAQGMRCLAGLRDRHYRADAG